MVVRLRGPNTSLRMRHPSADWRSEEKEGGEGEGEISPINNYGMCAIAVVTQVE